MPFDAVSWGGCQMMTFLGVQRALPITVDTVDVMIVQLGKKADVAIQSMARGILGEKTAGLACLAEAQNKADAVAAHLAAAQKEADAAAAISDLEPWSGVPSFSPNMFMTRLSSGTLIPSRNW